jgi:hypothetical protein
MSEPYLLTIYQAAPGTPLQKEQDPKATSAAGHMYYGLSNGKEQLSFGFAPSAHGASSGPGKVFDNDVANYKNPYQARTIEVTKEQYEKMKEFGRDPAKHGFDMNYNGANNSCVDFTWKALNSAGLHAYKNGKPDVNEEGAIRPVQNTDKVKSIPAPVPDSPHNKEQTNPLPERTWWQKLITEKDPAERAMILADAAKNPDWTKSPVVVLGQDGNFASLTRDPSGNIQSIEKFAQNGEPMGAKVSLLSADMPDPSLRKEQPKIQEPRMS